MLRQRDETGERTYEPTPLRLAEARRAGNVPRSRDLTAAAVLLAGLGLLALLGGRLLDETVAMTASMLDGAGENAANLDATAGAARSAVGGLLGVLAPFLLLLTLTGVLAGVGQVGLVAAPQRIHPDLSRVSPAAGLRRLWSQRTLVRFALSFVKIGAVAFIAALTLQPALPRLAAAGRLAPGQAAQFAGGMVLTLSLRIATALFILAVLDLLYERWKWQEDLKMTRREWLDDLKRMQSAGRGRGGRALRRADRGAPPAIAEVARAQ